jgi:hypothetical protein
MQRARGRIRIRGGILEGVSNYIKRKDCIRRRKRTWCMVVAQLNEVEPSRNLSSRIAELMWSVLKLIKTVTLP